MHPSGTVSALLLGAFTVATLHALIPSHWLAFAVVGRVRRWTSRRTLTVAALAGGGHVLTTVLLGWIIAAVGKQLNHAVPPRLEHAATAVLLIALGIYFMWPARRGHSGHESHEGADSERDNPPAHGLRGRLAGSPTVMSALILGMTLSPCLDLLSVFVAASVFSWRVLLAVSVIMAVTTLAVMMTLIWLTLHGLQRLNLDWLDRNEGLVMGGILVVLGILLFAV